MRWVALLLIPLPLLLVTCSDENAARIEEGRQAYSKYCALCHGEGGAGYQADNANALSHPEFLKTASDAMLTRAIARGRPGTSMSGWGKSVGGPLDDGAVSSIVAFMRSWQKEPSIALPDKVDGVAMRGQAAYDVHCLECHGKEGQGGKWMTISSPELLASVNDGYLQHAIKVGRSGTPMAGYEGALTAQTIDDLVALVRSWQRPPGSVGPLPPATLVDVVQNPNGPEPAFDPNARFTPADTIKTELDRGAAMVLLDARPPMDYTAGHIAGAVSVPFYDVDKYVSQLPKDRFIVCYCACPHAESGAACDALGKAGFPRRTILDEGYLVWRDRGYPTRTGPKP